MKTDIQELIQLFGEFEDWVFSGKEEGTEIFDQEFSLARFITWLRDVRPNMNLHEKV